MSKKIVIRADLIGEKCKSKIMSIVAKLEGIKSMDIDQDKCTLTVVGTRRPGARRAEAQEACEKAWKEKCEKACKEPCCDDCEKGTPSYRCTPGCYSSPCGLPSCHYYSNGYGYGPPPLGYACYEERSRGGGGGGECGIQ
ncbi:hypothetical protein VPH35_118785 [Triticum aestivum]